MTTNLLVLQLNKKLEKCHLSFGVKNLNYLQSTFFMINNSSVNLLDSIINKRYMQMIIVQKKLLKKELLFSLNKNH